MSQVNPTESEVDAYAGNYVLYGCQSKAWRVAFPDSKAKAESIHELASKFHHLHEVQSRIEELKVQVREVAEAEFKIDAAWVLRQAVKVHDKCMASAKVTDARGDPVLDDDGRPVYEFQHAGANKSLDIIGKHIDVQAFNENLSIIKGSEVTPWSAVKASVDKLDK